MSHSERELRPYQGRTIEDIRTSIRQGIRRIMVMLPTGAGKTVIAAEIIRMAREKGNKVAFVVPKIDLIDQSIESFWAHGIRDIGALQGNHHLTDYSKPVLVCSVQTLQARKYRPECKIVILDEAHVSYAFVKQWLSDPAWGNCIFIGLSATPFTRGLKKYYQTLLKPTSISELISLGYLSNFRVFATGHPNLSGVRTVAGDYVEHELSGAMQDNGLTADIVRTYQEKWNKGACQTSP